MRFPFASTLVVVVTGAVLLTWNGSRFVDAQARTRTKDLTFLPSPIVAKVLCLGHANSFAKLRWIDSFAYFERQLEVKDDTIQSSGESAFERLYRMLVALDPKFLPYYEHASLNLGGVLTRHDIALSIMQGGLLDLPHETQLWRMVAAELSLNFHGETAGVNGMDQFLTAWSESELTDYGRELVWDWKKAMGQRLSRELEQVPYWLEQLRRLKPGTPSHQYVLDTLREQVARLGESNLQALVDAYRELHRIPPITLADVVVREVITKAFLKGIPTQGPLTFEHGVFSLKVDPFGYAYELVNGKPLSPGWQRLRSTKRAGAMSEKLAEVAKREGRWPTTVAEAGAAGVVFDALPVGGTWVISGQVVTAQWTPAPFPAWTPP